MCRPCVRYDFGCLKSMVTAGGAGAAPAYIALVAGGPERTGVADRDAADAPVDGAAQSAACADPGAGGGGDRDLYVRRNRVQESVGDFCDVSQSTVSRAVSAFTPLVRAATADLVPADAQIAAAVADWICPGGRLIAVRGPLPAARMMCGRCTKAAFPRAGRCVLRVRRLGISRHELPHRASQTGGRPAERPATRVQRANQRNPRPDRTRWGEPEDLAHPEHRLPPTTTQLRRWPTRRHRPALVHHQATLCISLGLSSQRLRRTTFGSVALSVVAECQSAS
jgi:hypothetical protein